MVRFGRSVALVAAIAAALGSAAPARAQALQRLTVLSFALASDVGRPQVDVPFHLVVSLRVRERVGEIDNLELPMLAALELLGDERTLQSGPKGTAYTETIAVVAHRSGDITIAPAILQAVDAHDRRPKQYYSNGLTLHVAAAPGQALAGGAQAASSALWFFVQLTIWILGGLCVMALVVLLFRRRPAPLAVVPPAPLETIQTLPVRSSRDELRDALTVLRAERSRDVAVRVRALVWRMAGAGEGETLTDVLHRPASAPPATRELLRSLERAAFTYDADLPAAIDAASGSLERYLAT